MNCSHVLVTTTPPTCWQETHRLMAEQKVVIRYRGNCLHCNNCLRVTVGKPSESAKFLQMLETVVSTLRQCGAAGTG